METTTLPAPDSTAFPTFLSPLRMRGRTLPSRAVMTSHTTSLAESGLPGRRMRDYYCERAAGGAGMIVLEPVPAHVTARHAAANFVLDDTIIPPMRELGEAVRDAGAVVIAQVYNLGSFANPAVSARETWAPSADRIGRMRHPSHAMTRAEIQEMADGFVATASRMAAADLDGVEILMAYDGLIDSFFAPLRNKREDEYGGSLDNRLRLAREILTRVRESIGADRILGITITGDHVTPTHLHVDDAAEIAVALAETCELDYIAVANADQVTNHFLIPGMEVERGYGIQWARIIKQALPEMVITAEGRIQSPTLAEEALCSGAADLTGMARALITDPFLVAKARAGLEDEIRLCIACNQQCLGRRRHNLPILCTQNAAAGRESRYGARRLTPTPHPKRVAIVGGGPAGLEAAVVASGRGHRVTVIEREVQLGGQARCAARLPFSSEFEGVYVQRELVLRRRGVEIRTGVDADADAIAVLDPDVVILATGSRPRFDAIQNSFPLGIEVGAEARRRIYAAVDVAAGHEVPVGRTLVFDGDGHRKALGVAELLGRAGHQVELATEDLFVGMELQPTGALTPYRSRLAELGVALRASTALASFDGSLAILRSLYDGSETELEVDSIVLATQHAADDALREPLEARGMRVVVVGDAQAPRLLDNAISDAMDAAASL